MGRLLSSTPPRCFWIISINTVLSLPKEKCREREHSRMLLLRVPGLVRARLAVCCSFVANKCAGATTLFRLTGRLCCIAGALLIHGTIMVSLSLLEVINMSLTQRRSEFPLEKYAAWIPLIIYLCCVFVQHDKSISIMLHTERDFCIPRLRAAFSY